MCKNRDNIGQTALMEIQKEGRPNYKNRVAEEIEQAAVKWAVEQPAWGQTRVSNEMRKQGQHVAASTVRMI